MIYLDYNATAPVFEQVRTVMDEWLGVPANPSSVHAAGRKAKSAIEGARESIAGLLSVWANEILFTGSGTESNNMVLRAFSDRPILVGSTEHASVLKTAERLGGDTLAVDTNGIIDLEQLEKKLQALGRPALVSVMLVNNETGVIQPMAEISKIAKQYDALVHCDAVQAFGKIPVDFGLLGVDAMTLCGHKCGGPVGVGLLVLRNDLPIKPMLFGGGQELNRRAGTENVAAIMGLAKAMEISAKRDWLDDVSGWLLEMEQHILKEVPEAVILGQAVDRVGNTSCIAMPNVNSETQLMHFDLSQICVSAGSACSSGRIEASHVLKAMQIDENVASGAIRISAGWNTKQDEILSFTSAWTELYKRRAQKTAKSG
ncbi:MAG: cysteine desulfurase [Rickettsiales bacterium]|nr:cysteine desulfurase [Rickettsiales bacterium]